MSIDLILSQLQKVKPHGPGRWTACCPAHDDKNPSLSITEQQSGKISLKCWSGCSGHEITQALGITLEQLYPDWDAKTLYREFPEPIGARARSQQQKAERDKSRIELTLEFYKQDIKKGRKFSPEEQSKYMQMFKEFKGLNR